MESSDLTSLTSADAARRLGIARRTLLRATRRGELTPVSRAPGGSFRFRGADVEAYAQRRAVARAPGAPGQPIAAPVGVTAVAPASVAAVAPARRDDDRWRALALATGHIIWTTAADGRVEDDAPYWRAYTGQSVDAVRGLGWLDAVHGDDRPRVATVWAQAMAGGGLFETEHRLRRADGAYRRFLARAAPVRDDAGRILEWVGVCIDQTDRYHNEADLQATVEAALDAIVTINHAGRIVAFNPAAERVFGYSRDAVLGRELAEMLIPPDERYRHRDGLARYLATGEGAFIGRRVEVRALRADGSEFPAELAVTRIPLDGPPLFTAYVRDITERTQMEQALRHQALHDALTGLPNRTLLLDRLEQALAMALRDHHPVALLLLDLDHFKEVNDTCGHQYGDLLLQEVALRLRGALRDVDTVARLGGDEFAAILPGTDGNGTIITVRRLLAALEAPLVVEGRTLPGAASIGVALFPDHATEAQELLRCADVATYAAKQAHGRWAVYAPTRDPYSPGRLDLLADLRQAIARGELRLCYQPKAELTSGHIGGVEALVRWHHPKRGLIAPEQFIPLAEQTGLIAPLTHCVLAAALRQQRRWRSRGLRLSVAVNLSMWDVHDPQLSDSIATLLRRSAVPPSDLRVELTESTIMADADRALEVLSRLSELGVGISVDDFGTGYSSLAYLKRLPVDEIKIDRSFVQHVATDKDDAAIVTSTIGLGRGLDLHVVAEGVEDRQTWDVLAGLGCDAVQGYYLSRPRPAAMLERWLRTAPWVVA